MQTARALPTSTNPNMLATRVFRSAQPLKHVSIYPYQSFNSQSEQSLATGLPSSSASHMLTGLPPPPEHPPLCFTPRPRQHWLLEQRHLRPARRCGLTRRRLLLLPHHRTKTRSARSPFIGRTQDRAGLLSRSFNLGASHGLPRWRSGLHRPEARIRRGDQSQYEKIPLCPPQ